MEDDDEADKADDAVAGDATESSSMTLPALSGVPGSSGMGGQSWSLLLPYHGGLFGSMVGGTVRGGVVWGDSL